MSLQKVATRMKTTRSSMSTTIEQMTNLTKDIANGLMVSYQPEKYSLVVRLLTLNWKNLLVP